MINNERKKFKNYEASLPQIPQPLHTAAGDFLPYDNNAFLFALNEYKPKKEKQIFVLTLQS